MGSDDCKSWKRSIKKEWVGTLYVGATGDHGKRDMIRVRSWVFLRHVCCGWVCSSEMGYTI